MVDDQLPVMAVHVPLRATVAGDLLQATVAVMRRRVAMAVDRHRMVEDRHTAAGRTAAVAAADMGGNTTLGFILE